MTDTQENNKCWVCEDECETDLGGVTIKIDVVTDTFTAAVNACNVICANRFVDHLQRVPGLQLAIGFGDTYAVSRGQAA